MRGKGGLGGTRTPPPSSHPLRNAEGGRSSSVLMGAAGVSQRAGGGRGGGPWGGPAVSAVMRAVVRGAVACGGHFGLGGGRRGRIIIVQHGPMGRSLLRLEGVGGGGWHGPCASGQGPGHGKGPGSVRIGRVRRM